MTLEVLYFDGCPSHDRLLPVLHEFSSGRRFISVGRLLLRLWLLLWFFKFWLGLIKSCDARIDFQVRRLK